MFLFWFRFREKYVLTFCFVCALFSRFSVSFYIEFCVDRCLACHCCYLPWIHLTCFKDDKLYTAHNKYSIHSNTRSTLFVIHHIEFIFLPESFMSFCYHIQIYTKFLECIAVQNAYILIHFQTHTFTYLMPFNTQSFTKFTYIYSETIGIIWKLKKIKTKACHLSGFRCNIFYPSRLHAVCMARHSMSCVILYSQYYTHAIVVGFFHSLSQRMRCTWFEFFLLNYITHHIHKVDLSCSIQLTNWVVHIVIRSKGEALKVKLSWTGR